MRCVLAQIKINKVHEVLAQIIRDNFFLWKDKDINLAWASTNHNKQRKMWASTNDKDKKRCVLPQITTNKVQDVLA